MAFIYQIKKYPLRTVKTCLMGMIFVGLGLFIAAPGPSLLDLKVLAGTQLDKVALILPARSFGYAIGSVIAGVAGDKVDHQIILIASMIASVISIFLFPMFRSINLMYTFMVTAGIANGTLDTICNVWIIHIWGKENPPFMQVVHFMYGLGAFIAPFIVEPFLLNKADESEISGNSTKIVGTADEIVIQWPFYITAGYYFLTTSALILIYILYPDNSVHPSRSMIENDDPDAKKDPYRLKKPLGKWFTIFVIAISVIAMHAYVGLEISFGSLLSPFAVNSNLHMTKSEGAYLTSGYWFTYTFLRIFSLIAIIYLAPRFLLIINFAIIMGSNVILLPFANDHRWALWTGSALMGLGCSSVFATMFAFLEQLTPVTARITAAFLIAACAGEFIIPYVVAIYIETKPVVFLWVVFLYSSISFICVAFLIGLQHYLLKRQKSKVKEIELRSSSKEAYKY